MGVDSSIYREDGVVRCWYAGPDIDLTADLPGNNQYMVGSQGPSEVAKLIIGYFHLLFETFTTVQDGTLLLQTHMVQEGDKVETICRMGCMNPSGSGWLHQEQRLPGHSTMTECFALYQMYLYLKETWMTREEMELPVLDSRRQIIQLDIDAGLDGNPWEELPSEMI